MFHEEAKTMQRMDRAERQLGGFIESVGNLNPVCLRRALDVRVPVVKKLGSYPFGWL
jgi:hypothetical protein